jgi:hypothetical protein
MMLNFDSFFFILVKRLIYMSLGCYLLLQIGEFYEVKFDSFLNLVRRLFYMSDFVLSQCLFQRSHVIFFFKECRKPNAKSESRVKESKT